MQRNVIVAMLIVCLLSSTMVVGCSGAIAGQLFGVLFSLFGETLLQQIIQAIQGGSSNTESLLMPSTVTAVDY
ncbi:MAG: hypothetical protein JXQ73_16975 [Phycisphaerae bacterium]|nr:hypothetical protein [Phycisphaerae bacterium]